MIIPLGAFTGLALLCFSAIAQDSQRAATAKVVRDRGTAEAIEKTTPVAKEVTREGKSAAAAQSEGLNRRAGEQASDGARGRSVVLGMNLQETSNGRVRVVEVGAASPAFEAGIQKGDELISFGDFKADSYRKWIDGMRRVTTEALDGSMLPVAVMRNNQRLVVKIRVPEGHATTVQLPIGPPLAQQTQPAGEVGIHVNEGGNDTIINNVGAFGTFFSDEASPVSERAMAQLFRLADTPHATTDASRAPSNGPSDPNTGARIGLAGFRNDPNGMLVMVDVGGLEPGNYVVGIADPAILGGPAEQGNVAPPSVNLPAPAAPTNTTPPQSPQGDGAQGTTIPPNGQSRPLTTPASGQVNPSSTTATGQSTANIALNEQVNQANAARSGLGHSGGPMPTEVGTLTIDQSGTGRMQHVVEGVQVRNVVGQAIVIYAQASGSQKTLPPNLDPTVDPAAGDVSSAAGGTGSTSAITDPTQGVTDGTTSGPVTKQNTGASNPVAGGIIRLVSDRRPPPTTSAAPPDTSNSPARNQPASNAPLVPPKTVR